MNCCTEYGKCTQGDGCPVRAARMTTADIEPPITMIEPGFGWALMAEYSAAAMLASAVIGFLAGYIVGVVPL